MPAKSKAQQRFMGMVYAYKKGKKKKKDIPKNIQDKVVATASAMKDKDILDFVHTDTKNLPVKVKKESINTLKEIIRLYVRQSIIKNIK